MKTYDNINELIRDLDLDLGHWINKEATRFTSKKEYDKTEVRIKNVPEEFLQKKFECPEGHIFSPDWLKKRPPVSVFYEKDKGFLRQKAVNIKCPKCDSDVEVQLPQAEYKTDLDIYGDEALRTVDNKKVFVYSFVSFSGSNLFQSSFRNQFLNWKKNLVPSIPPEDWIFHMTEILSGSTRKKTEHLEHLDFHKVKAEIDRLLELIKTFNEKRNLNIYSAIGMSAKAELNAEERRHFKENAYNSCLMRVVAQSVNHGLAPRFYFEKTGDDGWAKNLFDGGRLTLLWTYLTKGLPVMTPDFVKPSYNFLLEIADIVSYVIARKIFCIGKRVEGKEDKTALFNPSQLGGIRYTLTDASGNWNYEFSKDFPGKEMFKNTEWEKFL
ncbi:hypothetical protein NC796_24765 [Aliifodinibius sp. S!AR15-10]|uniref:DUF3800 domain-containing protein n=1 Tax=Aliifodinibius sp. S!AR15-10 TaxID=2950437 RepID=UPI002861BC42|nr:hypothetical protein [Aliifodinibius sp. S!AR15-10]MDR8394384.1 hypothetical protein [Aliifodinibius sp. S!AR15-10]